MSVWKSALVFPLFLMACGEGAGPGDAAEGAEPLAARTLRTLAAPRSIVALDRHVRLETVARPVCLRSGEAALGTLTAVRESGSTIHLTLEGHTCGAEVDGFGFEVLDAEGHNIAGRSWPEVDALEVTEAGRFTLRGAAWSCGNLDAGETLVVRVGEAEVAAAIQ